MSSTQILCYSQYAKWKGMEGVDKGHTESTYETDEMGVERWGEICKKRCNRLRYSWTKRVYSELNKTLTREEAALSCVTPLSKYFLSIMQVTSSYASTNHSQSSVQCKLSKVVCTLEANQRPL